MIKWPGSVHDTRVLGNSGINTKLREKIIPPCKKTIVDGEQAVPVCILGDAAYPLLPYLMKEFARIVVECAFGRLKSRFTPPPSRDGSN